MDNSEATSQLSQIGQQLLVDCYENQLGLHACKESLLFHFPFCPTEQEVVSNLFGSLSVVPWWEFSVWIIGPG